MILHPSKVKINDYLLYRWENPTENLIAKIKQIDNHTKYLFFNVIIEYNSLVRVGFKPGDKHSFYCNPESTHIIFADTIEDLHKILIFQ